MTKSFLRVKEVSEALKISQHSTLGLIKMAVFMQLT
jgi:hypothetical protein